MNTLTLFDPILHFGENAHPFCEAGFSIVKRRVNCLLDTGFTFGFAFSKKSIPKFKFTEGFLMTMMLGNGRPIKGMVFVVSLELQKGNERRVLGNTSAVFIEKPGDPLIGVETMKLFSPLGLDWKSLEITSTLWH
jgi:hypothetical protein